MADFAALGEDARRAAPTPEHFWPLLYVLGARLPGDGVRLVNDRIEHGSLGMTSVVFDDGRDSPRGGLSGRCTRIRLPRWAVERGAALNDFPALEAGRTALVNIDMQSAFLAEDQAYGNAHARDIVPRVNALSQAMRAAGAPVIWTRQTYTRRAAAARRPTGSTIR